MIVYLILFLIIILGCSFAINHDILFPSNILTFSFLICAIYALLLMKKVDDFMLYKTFLLLVIFIGLFAIASNFTYLIEKCFHHKYHRNMTYNLRKDNKLNYKIIPFINIDRYKVILVVIIQLFILLIIIVFLKKTLGSISSQSLSTFRESTEYQSQGSSLSIPYWFNLLINLSKFTSFFSMFVLINNHFSNVKYYESKPILILSSVLFIPLMILSSSRYSFIVFVFYSLFLYIYFSKYAKKNILMPMIYIVALLSFIVWLFKIMGGFIGRTTSNFLIYIGGSIVSLNNYIRFHPVVIHDPNKLIGTNTFNTLYKGLYKLHLIDKKPTTDVHLFDGINGYPIGNVYTAIRPFYEDFGLSGIVLASLILGCIFGFLYWKIKSIKLTRLSMLLMIYAIISGNLMLSSYSESILGGFLSLGFMLNLIMLYLLKLFYKV